jgi:predicted metal-binding membrane protein
MREASRTSGVSGLLGALVAQHPTRTAVILAISSAAWTFTAWMALDMDHPLAQLMMPPAGQWRVSNMIAILLMWSVMMAAMMLPSGLPMILTFAHLSALRGERARARVFVAAYLLVWIMFSATATSLQWGLQAMGWVDPMAASTSARLTAWLLLIAGVYQFSPLKRACLARCRTPLGFLLGEWRGGAAGAWRMGLRHGVLCAGCCWALMVLLFIGGAMNLAWVAALAIVVAIEKMAPRGERIAAALGLALIAAGLWKLVPLFAA